MEQWGQIWSHVMKLSLVGVQLRSRAFEGTTPLLGLVAEEFGFVRAVVTPVCEDAPQPCLQYCVSSLCFL